MDAILATSERLVANTMIVAALALGVTLVASYLIWGWGLYMFVICICALVMWAVGFAVTAIRAEFRAEKALPYKIKSQAEVKKELNERLTAADLIEAAGMALPVSAVAGGRWKDTGTMVGSAVANVVFGPLLASTEYRGGFLGVSGRQLVVVSMGVVIGEILNLVKLDSARGKVSWQAFDLDTLAVTETTSGANLVLQIKGPVSMIVTFPAAFDANNVANARLVAEAIRKAQRAEGAATSGDAISANTQPKGWSEETKGAVCFYSTIPFFLIGGIIAANQGNPAPAPGAVFLLAALACSIGAIRFRYHHYATGMTPLAVWCAPITVSMMLVAAIAMAFGAK